MRTELDVTLEDPNATTDDLRAMATVIGDANTRMERLIASLLALASSEAGVASGRSADLGRAVRPALDRERAFYVGGPLRLEATLDDAPVLGDPVLLERMAANLIENAVRYNAAVGWVRVWSGTEHGEAVLRVANSGAQIAAHELDGLLEPFRRLESSRARVTGGYGLGLAVVRAVAEAHGGRVRLHARDEGGLEVTVALPLERDRRRVPALVG